MLPNLPHHKRQRYPPAILDMTEQAVGYNFGPVEAWPTITDTISRSLSVWSPGNGTISGVAWAT